MDASPRAKLRRWSHRVYVIVDEDCVPDGMFRALYPNPETPMRLIERFGASRLLIVELDVKKGKLWRPRT